MIKQILPPQAVFKALVVFTFCAASSLVYALELGQVSVASSLQAPLNATIPLHGSDAYSLGELDVTLADEHAFAGAGLEWMPVTDSVSVALEEAQGSRRVAIHSVQPITSPWIDLLLSVEYPEGRLVHPVTLLLDPPGYGQDSSPQGAISDSQTVAMHAIEPESARLGEAATVSVQPGDTLWSIAERSKPAETSVQQMMLALVQVNPSIFPGGNINSLQSGQRLKVPGAEQALTRSRADAAKAVQVMVRTGQYEAAALESDPEPGAKPSPEQANVASDQRDMSSAETPAVIVPSNAIPEQPDVIATLTTRLEESQASLQQAEAEREQLRLALGELRTSVDALSQRIEGATSLSGPMAANAGVVETGLHDQHHQHSASSRDFLTGLERYQWPLISLALGLLLVGLIWLRKWREVGGDWQGTQKAEPALFTAGASPDAETSQTAKQNIPLSQDDEPTLHAAPQHHAGEHMREDASFAAESSRKHEISAPGADRQAPPLDADYSRSQAAGLADQRYREPFIIHESPRLAPVHASPNDLASSTPSDSKQSLPRWEIEEVAFTPRGRDND